MLYQLSYSRERSNTRVQAGSFLVARGRYRGCRAEASHGGEGDRTPDLLNAIQALSQLSYAPAVTVFDVRRRTFRREIRVRDGG